jgi:hypothetical protein
MRLPKPTYANFTASIALFVALGGTSYAVIRLPRNSVGSLQVRDGSLQRKDLASGVAGPAPRGPRGAEGPVGPQGVRGLQGDRGPASIWLAPQKPSVSLPTNANVGLEVRRIANLPAGSWELKFSADVISTFAGEAIFSCAFTINGDRSGGSGVVVGQVAPAVQQVGLLVDTVATSATTFTPIVTCSQDQPNSPSPVIAGAQIIATQVADITKAP